MPEPTPRYRTIVADPPWPIRWSVPYPTMPVDAIADLAVAEFVEDDAHLFMWTLDRFVLDGTAARVCRAWGFEPLPQMIVWAKANAGLGRFVRPAHELVLIGRRGDARFRPVSVRSVYEWKQTYVDGSKLHSAKPEAMLDVVESLSDGPYLELFARRQRFGWDTWGNQARCDVAIGASDG